MVRFFVCKWFGMKYDTNDWLALSDAIIDCSFMLMVLLLVVGIFQ
jgi:hypothetical protein